MPSELDRAVYTTSVNLLTRKYALIRAAAATHCLSYAILARRLNDSRSYYIGYEL
jgi:hypothetical protein